MNTFFRFFLSIHHFTKILLIQSLMKIETHKIIILLFLIINFQFLESFSAKIIL